MAAGIEQLTPETRTFAPGNPLVFTHIPRTAGTSLREALVATLKPRRIYTGVDKFALGSFSDIESIRPRARALIAFSAADVPPLADFVTGHLTPATTMARYPNSQHLTVLREPRVRVLSLWLFNNAHSDFMFRHWGPLKDRLRVARSSFSAYLSEPALAPHMDNHITRFLAWPHPAIPDADFIDPSDDEALFAAAAARLERYAFVGCMENPLLADEIGAWLGHVLVMSRSLNAVPLPRNRRPNVYMEFRALGGILDARTRIDARIWEHVVRQTMPGSDPRTLAEQVLQKALQTYALSIAQAPHRGYVRTAVEGAYEIGDRLQSCGGAKRRERKPVR